MNDKGKWVKKYLVYCCFLWVGLSLNCFSEGVSEETNKIIELNRSGWRISLDKKHRIVRFDVTILASDDLTSVPSFYAVLKNRRKEELLRIGVTGEVCNGEYDSVLSYFKTNNDIEYYDFTNKIQSTETFTIEIRMIKSIFQKYRYAISVNEEALEVDLMLRARQITFGVLNGEAKIENLRVLSKGDEDYKL